MTCDRIGDRVVKYINMNLNHLERIPEKLKERIFEQLFEAAEISKFSQEEVRDYEDSLKYYRDLKNSMDTAKEEGVEEGVQKEKIETAKKMISAGFETPIIIEMTDLSSVEIDVLR